MIRCSLEYLISLEPGREGRGVRDMSFLHCHGQLTRRREEQVLENSPSSLEGMKSAKELGPIKSTIWHS